MKLAAIFPIMNQRELAETAVGFAVKQLSGATDTELLVIDNASNPSMEAFALNESPNGFKSKYVRLEKNIGVYPIFWEALKHTDADILAFFHSDLIIDEKGWDKRVIDLFASEINLGLVGFIGSNEIDSSGGRGLGTTSNFLGGEYLHSNALGQKKIWKGSAAHIHGRVSVIQSPAAVVDGCAMIFRRSVLEQIKQREDFPPHHFYDRLLSSEVREKGFDMAVLGIGCDHISGQTVANEPAYEVMAKEWTEAHGIHKEHNWDSALYHVAERQWLKEYRDIKHLVPCKV